MEGEVAREVGAENGVVQRPRGDSGVDGFHPAVETHDEVIEIQTQAQTIGDGEFAQERVEAELSALGAELAARGPHVAGVDEGGAFKFPKERTAILHREVDFQIAGLVDEVDVAVLLCIAPRAELAHVPTADRIGTAGEITLFVGDDLRVAEGDGDAKGGVPCQRVCFGKANALREVDIELDVLRIRYAENRVAAVGILVHAEHFGDAVEEVAGSFHAGTDLIAVGAIEVAHAGRAERVVDKTVGRAHDEEVLIRIAQDGVARIVAFEVGSAEGVGNPRHEDVVERGDVEVVAQVGAGVAIPIHAPRGSEQSAIELGTILRIVHQREVGRTFVGAQVALAGRNGQRGEAQGGFDTIFRVILIAITFELANGFVSTAKFEEEALRATEEVALRVGEGGRSAKIAGRVRAFQVEGDAVGLVELHEQVDVHGRIAWRRLGVVNVRIVYCGEGVEILISILRGDVSIKAIGQNE